MSIFYSLCVFTKNIIDDIFSSVANGTNECDPGTVTPLKGGLKVDKSDANGGEFPSSPKAKIIFLDGPSMIV